MQDLSATPLAETWYADTWEWPSLHQSKGARWPAFQQNGIGDPTITYTLSQLGQARRGSGSKYFDWSYYHLRYIP